MSFHFPVFRVVASLDLEQLGQIAHGIIQHLHHSAPNIFNAILATFLEDSDYDMQSEEEIDTSDTEGYQSEDLHPDRDF